jgi:hypothetical protein
LNQDKDSGQKQIEKNQRVGSEKDSNIRSGDSLVSFFFVLLLLTLGLAFGFQLVTFPQNKEVKEAVKSSF